MSSLAHLIAAARHVRGFREHFAAGVADPIHVVQKPAVTPGSLRLLHDMLPRLPQGTETTVYRPVRVLPGGNQVRLDAAVIAASRVAQMGAHVIVAPYATDAIPLGKSGGVAFTERVGRFDSLSVAPMTQVSDGTDIAASGLPVARSKIMLGDAPNVALRFELKRSTQKEIGDDLLAAEVMQAIVMALARAADAQLLAAINATTPTPFRLDLAASAGLKFGELRALVGSGQANYGQTVARVCDDGVLRFGGIPAELTADASGAYVGDFRRAAVVISEDVPLLVERRSTQGDLVLTAWATMQALVPDANRYFWSA